MATLDLTKWSVVLAATLGAASAVAQAPHDDALGATAVAFERTMTAGLVPLFTAIGVGVAIMLLVAFISAWIIRPHLPRFPTSRA